MQKPSEKSLEAIQLALEEMLMQICGPLNQTMIIMIIIPCLGQKCKAKTGQDGGRSRQTTKIFQGRNDRKSTTHYIYI